MIQENRVGKLLLHEPDSRRVYTGCAVGRTDLFQEEDSRRLALTGWLNDLLSLSSYSWPSSNPAESAHEKRKVSESLFQFKGLASGKPSQRRGNRRGLPKFISAMKKRRHYRRRSWRIS